MEPGRLLIAIVQAVFYNRQMQMDHFNMEPTDLVQRLTGREPAGFEIITKQYFENSAFKRRSFLSWLKAFIKFNTIPFVRVPDKKEILDINR